MNVVFKLLDGLKFISKKIILIITLTVVPIAPLIWNAKLNEETNLKKSVLKTTL